MATDSDTRVESAQQLLGYVFKNRNLLLEALHALCANPFSGFRHGARPLAIVGNAAMRLVVASKWYKAGLSPGEINDHIDRVVSNTNLTACSPAAGLGSLVYLNPSQRGIVSQGVLLDTVKAVIGAAFMDGGIDATRAVMKAMGLT